MSDGVAGYGCKFGIADAATTSVTAFAEVTNISGPGIEADDIDMTHMQSPDKYREYISGLIDGGQVDIELNYTADQSTTFMSLIGVSRVFGIEFADSTSTASADRSKFIFSGYEKSVGFELPLDDKISTTANFKISGKPVYVKGANA